MNVFSRVYNAIKTVITEYPAVLGFLLTTAVGFAAHFGWNVTPDTLVYIWTIANALVLAYVHSSVTPEVRAKRRVEAAKNGEDVV